MTTQPYLFDPGPPQPVSTDALLRRLVELEDAANLTHRLGGCPFALDREICPPCRAWWRKSEAIRAELFARGHAVGGPRRG